MYAASSVFVVADVISSKEEPGVEEDRPAHPRCLPDCDSITKAEANV